MSAGPVRAHLGRWGFGPAAALRLLHVSENETYLAREGERALVLRLHRRGYHSEAEIRSELAWLGALRDAGGLSCAEPVAGTDGEFVQTVEVAGERRHVVAFAPAGGQEPAPDEDLSALFAELGTIAGRLHVHARGWRTPPGFARKRWDTETILGRRPLWGRWQDTAGVEPGQRALIARAAAELAGRLAAYDAEPGRCGLVHADLRLANLLVDGDRITVIDFDDCGFAWWMYDFAASVSFIEDDPRVPALAARWEEGYRRVARLEPDDRAILPALVLLRRVLLLAWIGSRAEAGVAATFDGARFAAGTAELAERFLTAPPGRFWPG